MIITSIFVVVIFSLMTVVVVFATSFSFPTLFLITTIVFNITCSVFSSYFLVAHIGPVLPLVNQQVDHQPSIKSIRNADLPLSNPTKFRLIFDVGDPCSRLMSPGCLEILREKCNINLEVTIACMLGNTHP